MGPAEAGLIVEQETAGAEVGPWGKAEGRARE